MTNQELQNLVERWSQESFGRPFLHQAVFNRRLKTTGGRYHLGDHHIDINPLMLEEYDLATLKQVVLHELCHYHLHLTGQGFGHRDRDFKALLMQVGGAGTPRRLPRPGARGSGSSLPLPVHGLRSDHRAQPAL